MTNTDTTTRKSRGAIIFIARCSGVALLSYEIALSLGMPKPLWAVISALFVSQVRLTETRSSLIGLLLGTLIGTVATIIVSEVGSRAGVSIAVQMAAGVALTAIAAREFPHIRVAKWTCPIILLSTEPSVPIIAGALHRVGEVILGAVIGWIFHWAAEALVDRFTGPLGPLQRSGQRSVREDSTSQAERRAS